jgi:hypothetical protein
MEIKGTIEGEIKTITDDKPMMHNFKIIGKGTIEEVEAFINHAFKFKPKNQQGE